MELKENIIKIILTALLIFSINNVYAENSVSDCIVDVSKIEQSNSNSITEEITEIKNGKYKKQKTCASEFLVESLPTKVLYMIFGDIIKDSSSWAQTIFFEDSNIDESFDNMKNILNFESIKVVFTTITTIITALAALILAIQGLHILIASSNNADFIGQKINVTFTFIKMALGISLIIPIIDGYSAAQLMILISASLATLVANFLWAILSFTITATVFNEVGKDKLMAESDSLEMMVDNISNSYIEINICDLERRYLYLEKDSGESKVSLTSHNNNEFNKCLNENKDLDVLNNKKSYTPKDIVLTNYCIDNVYSKVHDSCGQVGIKDITFDYSEVVNFESINKKSRSIASKIINLSCMDKNLLKKYGKPYLYGYSCAELTDGEYNFSNGNINYININTDKKEKIKEIKKEISELSNEITNFGNKITSKRIDDGQLKEKIINITERSFMHGWFGASHFLLDITNNIHEITKNINNSREEINISRNLGSNKDILNSFNLDDNHIMNKYTLSISNIWDKIEKQNNYTGFMMGVKDLFKGIFTLNEFLGINYYSNIGDEVNSDESCFKDFSNCKYVTINPLYNYVMMGNDILNKSATVIIPTTALEKLVFKKMNQSELSGIYGAIYYISGILLALLKIYFAVGLLIVYVTPFIPFLHFMSYIIGWIILVMEGVVTSQIWALLHLIPSKKEGFLENVKSGYVIMLTIIIQPAILIIAMILSLVATSIAIGIYNVLFGIILTILPISANPSGIMEFVFTIIAYCIYAVLLTIVIMKVTKIIFEIPESLTKTINLTTIPSNNTWNEVTQRLNTIINFRVLNMLKI